jgi:hypothetical protein
VSGLVTVFDATIEFWTEIFLWLASRTPPFVAGLPPLLNAVVECVIVVVLVAPVEQSSPLALLHQRKIPPSRGEVLSAIVELSTVRVPALTESSP